MPRPMPKWCPPSFSNRKASERVVRQDHVEDHAGVEEVPVDVVADERHLGLTAVALVGLGDGAGRRREPEGPVVGLPVVVTGEPEAQREDQDEDRRGEEGVAREEADVRRTLLGARVRQAWRVERRDVRVLEVVLVGEGPDCRVDDERHQHEHGDERLQPPPVRSEGLGVDPCASWRAGTGRSGGGHAFPSIEAVLASATEALVLGVHPEILRVGGVVDGLPFDRGGRRGALERPHGIAAVITSSWTAIGSVPLRRRRRD